MTTIYDLIIVGGGPIGATLALSLAKLPLRIALIEAKNSVLDNRTLALTQVSKQIYTSLGIWSQLSPHTHSIEHIHVSDRGYFGKTRFHASTANVPALGYTIALRHLQSHLPLAANTTFISPAHITSVLVEPNQVALQVNVEGTSQLLQTPLLIAADGANSFVRKTLQVPTLQHDYQQNALTTQVHFTKPHLNTAYERFTATGPLALLPVAGQQAALVWVGTADQIHSLQNCSETHFLQQLQDTFGYHLGKFTAVGLRENFPLHLIWAKEQVRPRVVIVGNAQHSLHPIAAQGFNLGLRDVASLAQTLTESYTPTADLGSLNILQRFAAVRQNDQAAVIHATHSLVQLFSNHLSPLAHLRSAGMLALDVCPPLKRWVTRRAMGFSGHA